jgi:hypothetical protein
MMQDGEGGLPGSVAIIRGSVAASDCGLGGPALKVKKKDSRRELSVSGDAKPRTVDREMTAAIEQCPDGRVCFSICNESDASPDLVDAKMFMAWYYNFDPLTGKTVGTVCHYCGRAWVVYFKKKYPKTCGTLQLFIGELGTNEAIRAELKLVRDKFVDLCKAQGKTIGVTFKISDSDIQIWRKERSMHCVEDEDEHVEMEYYKQMYKGGLELWLDSVLDVLWLM